MIIHKCIESHLKGCSRWITVLELRVLLIKHYLIREILVETILDVHVKGAKIESFLIEML